MNLEIHKIKASPIKFVTFEDKVIGAFHNGQYINQYGFDEKLWEVVNDSSELLNMDTRDNDRSCDKVVL